ncbi:MAG: hypothetical protein ACOX8W_07740 [bacterium]
MTKYGETASRKTKAAVRIRNAGEIGGEGNPGLAGRSDWNALLTFLLTINALLKRVRYRLQNNGEREKRAALAPLR